MIQKNNQKLLGVGVLIVGVFVLVLSYLLSSLLFFFFGTFLVVLGVLLIIFIQALALFTRDKELNIEQLQKMGLSIVKCPECLKENVLEDIYCIYCGERLVKKDDGISKEY